MVNLNYIRSIRDNFINKKELPSFCIDNQFYTYEELGNLVAQIIEILKANTGNIKSKRVAVLCTDNINTYASIIAVWFCGFAYVPLGLHNPHERNITILKDAEVNLILSTRQLDPVLYSESKIADTSLLTSKQNNIPEITDIKKEDLAYILFTSGSTGKPKGVPISFGNLEAFLLSFKNSPVVIKERDKCLQMFELTFDVSISSFLPALLAGATVYTVADEGIRYINVLKIIYEKHLNVIQIVPSVIRLAMPLLNRMRLNEVTQCILTGEATTIDLVDKWKTVIPNAKLFNYYGPTECTIYCSCYAIETDKVKQYNGMLAIGRSFDNTEMIIIDENLNEVPNGEKGELVFYSPQLTEGYLNNENKNKDVFIEKLKNNKIQRYYRSGDMCYSDNDGDIFYCGRYDNQIKIQGFRVELNEIEFAVRKAFEINCVAMAILSKLNTTEIFLILESKTGEEEILIIDKLKKILPSYMIPAAVLSMQELPLNSSGKTDRVKVKQFIDAFRNGPFNS